ncbi:hypothetical protein HS088_TW15G00899 [Tripterygium wilfordii]|uniref:TOD1/MUCI70 glycosyltransferase-like domain-containing protein n=1 Tax=Tripterygium wilfordii TaxID=458696 RepID=A0A7J7CMT5_TRIWF|nr:uncharacterized protein LOC120016614 [Tripterygium wilfordii]KAF5735397.1 hypothetical protein HS088_TW15G00899 [Tripterygium wilfordii]
MAQYRQSGTERFGRHDLHHHSPSSGSSDQVSIGIRPSTKPARSRRSARSDKSRSCFSVGTCVAFLGLLLAASILAYYLLSRDKVSSNQAEDDELKSDSDFLTNVTRTDAYKVLWFGHGSAGHGGDSRYWDRDDRRRDEGYTEDEVGHSNTIDGVKSSDHGKERAKSKNGKDLVEQIKSSEQRGERLYNEDGRNELTKYEAEYEESLKNAGQSVEEISIKDYEDYGKQSEAIDDGDKEYDDGNDFNDDREEDDNFGHEKGYHSDGAQSYHEDRRDSFDFSNVSTIKNRNVPNEEAKVSINSLKKDSSLNSRDSITADANSIHVSAIDNHSTSKSGSEPKRKPKRRKFSGPCGMKFLNSTAQLVEPFESRKFARFSLQYKKMEKKPQGPDQWEPRFAGHQSLQEREESFLVNDKSINCGFIRSPEGSQSTGFDLSEDDANYISRCHIAVISCIFGNSDRLRSPTGKTVTRLSRKNVCFVIFVDEITFQTVSSEGQMPDRSGFIGLWKVVIVKNPPYTDMRRVGKIPKLLPHRLFPSARYSIWLDSKLRLQIDPLLILEYLLWRKGYEYAISNHYDRHCVWEEVAQNKRLNKYNHSIIDQQFASYQADGLKRFNASDPNKLLPSNVPEGSLIVRAHTPMSNLFSCLWFNEVERFTPRDQLSFAFTYQKLRRMNPDKPFYLNMFKDCERRAIAKLFRHRSEEKRTIRQQATD